MGLDRDDMLNQITRKENVQTGESSSITVRQRIYGAKVNGAKSIMSGLWYHIDV